MSIFFVAAHGLIEKNGRFLVTQRVGGDNYMPDHWDLPGGTIEVGETVEMGLRREIKEETGIEVDVVGPMYVYTTLSQLPQRQNVTILYRCRHRNGEVVLNAEEHQNSAWMTWEEIRVLPHAIHWLREMGEKLDVAP